MALYIIENRTTVRAAARKFGISKSTVHKDLSERLPAFNRTLYLQVKQVLDENKAERHIRGHRHPEQVFGEKPPGLSVYPPRPRKVSKRRAFPRRRAFCRNWVNQFEPDPLDRI